MIIRRFFPLSTARRNTLWSEKFSLSPIPEGVSALFRTVCGFVGSPCASKRQEVLTSASFGAKGVQGVQGKPPGT
jgi:hypothetical protein